jgi:hypothetical protein
VRIGADINVAVVLSPAYWNSSIGKYIEINSFIKADKFSSIKIPGCIVFYFRI